MQVLADQMQIEWQIKFSNYFFSSCLCILFSFLSYLSLYVQNFIAYWSSSFSIVCIFMS